MISKQFVMIFNFIEKHSKGRLYKRKYNLDRWVFSVNHD